MSTYFAAREQSDRDPPKTGQFCHDRLDLMVMPWLCQRAVLSRGTCLACLGASEFYLCPDRTVLHGERGHALARGSFELWVVEHSPPPLRAAVWTGPCQIIGLADDQTAREELAFAHCRKQRASIIVSACVHRYYGNAHPLLHRGKMNEFLECLKRVAPCREQMTWDVARL